MKTLLASLLVISSLNVFSAEVGEDKKGECIFADQSAKREAKVVIDSSSEKEKKETATVSK